MLVVTGSELVRGERSDRNGPFLARELLSLGVEPARIILVGDVESELDHALAAALLGDFDLCVTSGGLGPTHDDRTVELVARNAQRQLVVDRELEARIDEFSRGIAERLNRPYADFAAGVTKQATIPEGAIVLGLAGTAPGLALEAGATAVVVLPGPPAELQRLWPRALDSAPVRRVLERARPPQRRLLRFYGASESAIARALAEAGGDGAGVEATICARDFEIHVDLVVAPGAEERAGALEAAIRAPTEQWLFSEDERPVEAIVLDLCREQGLMLATAESCTGGMVGARLTSVPGSSASFLGGIVAYADAVKVGELGVPQAMLAEHGAVSREVAAAMAEGARARLGADVAVSVTGVAGPDGGTESKPVGTVFLHAAGPGGERSLDFSYPGDRDGIRRRSTVAALHLVRRLLLQS